MSQGCAKKAKAKDAPYLARSAWTRRMRAKTLGAQLQLLVPTTINAGGVEVGVLKTQYEPW